MSSHRHRYAPAHAYSHFLVEIKGHGQDEFITGVGYGQYRIQKSHVAACRDHEHGL